MSNRRRITRRSALRLGAAASALPLVHIRTAGAAGKLSLGFWDHWVPKANVVLRNQVNAWAEKNHVDVTIDFITSSGGKLMLTAAAEFQARAGHDVLPVANWDVINYADRMEPMDDVVTDLQQRYGPYSETYAYLGKAKGHWRAVPTSTGSLNLTCVGRISLLKQHAGVDVQAMYPAAPSDKPLGAAWTYDTFRRAAQACHKAGHPFGLGLGTTNEFDQQRRLLVQCVRRRTGGRAGQPAGQVRQGARLSGMGQNVRAVPAVQHGQLRRRLQ